MAQRKTTDGSRARRVREKPIAQESDEPFMLPEFGHRTKLVTVEGNAKAVRVLLVRCPREDCGQEHMVAKKAWLASTFRCRACPYCFKTAMVPGR